MGVWGEGERITLFLFFLVLISSHLENLGTWILFLAKMSGLSQSRDVDKSLRWPCMPSYSTCLTFTCIYNTLF